MKKKILLLLKQERETICTKKRAYQNVVDQRKKVGRVSKRRQTVFR